MGNTFLFDYTGDVLIYIHGTHGVELEGDDGPDDHERHGADVGREAGQHLPVGEDGQHLGLRIHLHHLDCLSLKDHLSVFIWVNLHWPCSEGSGLSLLFKDEKSRKTR